MNMEDVKTNKPLTVTETYLLESAGTNRQMAIKVIELVAAYQGTVDWRLAQWQQITADDLPRILERLRSEYPNNADMKSAIGIIKGVARCAWRQKLMSGQQLAEISKWKGDQ